MRQTLRFPLAIAAVPDDDWQRDALCAQTDPDAFFPNKGGSSKEAKAICKRCSVRPQCLDYAVATNERNGVWGGMSERERRRYIRVNRIKVPAPPVLPERLPALLPAAGGERKLAG